MATRDSFVCTSKSLTTLSLPSHYPLLLIVHSLATAHLENFQHRVCFKLYAECCKIKVMWALSHSPKAGFATTLAKTSERYFSFFLLQNGLLVCCGTWQFELSPFCFKTDISRSQHLPQLYYRSQMYFEQQYARNAPKFRKTAVNTKIKAFSFNKKIGQISSTWTNCPLNIGIMSWGLL